MGNAGAAFSIWSARADHSHGFLTKLFLVALIIGVIFATISVYYLEREDWNFTKTYLHALLLHDSKAVYEDINTGEPMVFSTGQEFLDANGHLWPDRFRIRVLGLWGGVFLLFFVGTMWTGIDYFSSLDDERRKPKFLGGTEVISVEQLNKDITKTKEPLGGRVGGTRQPKKAETQGTFIIGAARSGKTQLIFTMLVDLIKGASKGLIYGWRADEYFAKFFNPNRDLVFCPADDRSIRWNFFRDITDPVSDIPKFAACLIQTPQGAGQNSWVYDDGREIMSAIILYCYVYYRNDMSTIMSQFWKLLCLTQDELREKLKTQPGCEVAVQFLIESKTGNAAQARLSEMKKQTKFFEHMQKCNDGFSIQQWLSNGNPGFIFVQNRAKSSELITGILTLFIDVFARAVADLPTNIDNRIFMLCDEIGTLNKTKSLIELATRGGVKGISLYIATQDFGQLLHNYGENGLTSINNSTSSKMILRCPDGGTAKRCSEMIGKQRVLIKTITTQGSKGEFRGGTTESEHDVERDAVMAATIQGMNPLEVYVKFPGYRWAQTVIRAVKYPDKVEPFIPNPDVKITEAPKPEAPDSSGDDLFN